MRLRRKQRQSDEEMVRALLAEAEKHRMTHLKAVQEAGRVRNRSLAWLAQNTDVSVVDLARQTGWGRSLIFESARKYAGIKFDRATMGYDR